MKISKSCKYTGHMRIMNKGMNINKETLDTTHNKSNMQFEHGQPAKHEKKGAGIVYPETACTCK